MHREFLKTLIVLSAMLFVNISSSSAQSDEHSLSVMQQRGIYKDARAALRQGAITRFNKLRGQIPNYPLKQYLDYYELQRRLYKLPVQEVDVFLQQWPQSPLARRLQNQWLMALGDKRKWQLLSDSYPLAKDGGLNSKLSDEVNCYYLRALYNTGDKPTALSLTGKAWLVGRSQPDHCDYMFQIWAKTGARTKDLAWERMGLAVRSNRTSLAAYLVRFLDKKDHDLAYTYRRLRHRSRLVAEKARFKTAHPRNTEVITYGLQRYARYKPEKALALWQYYQPLHDFSAAQKQIIEHKIAVKLAERFSNQSHSYAASVDAQGQNVSLLESRLRVALKDQDWAMVWGLLQLLPEATAGEDRWQYWRLRSAEQLLSNSPDSIPGAILSQEQINQGYRELAGRRGFYNFMAADRVKAPYALDRAFRRFDVPQVNAMEQHPAVARALELYVLGEHYSARTEWRFATSIMNNDQLLLASEVAKRWGWHRQAIHATIAGQLWDYLDLRFPMPFQEQFIYNARIEDIEVNWSLAVARQESAFMSDAKSPAGALGLMQLMPATAKSTARGVGFTYRNKNQLLTPSTNILLGSRYLGLMERKFDGNRVLATAAYNAGPHRVSQWLKLVPRFPSDIFIESIPFNETRNYVQNVLAFSVIYQSRLELPTKLFRDAEVAKLADIADSSSTNLNYANEQALSTKKGS